MAKKYIVHFIKSFDESPVELNTEEFLKFEKLRFADAEIEIGGLKFYKKHIQKIRVRDVEENSPEHQELENLRYKTITKQRSATEKIKDFILRAKEKLPTMTSEEKGKLEEYMASNFHACTFAIAEIINQGISDAPKGLAIAVEVAEGYEKIIPFYFDHQVTVRNRGAFDFSFVKKFL